LVAVQWTVPAQEAKSKEAWLTFTLAKTILAQQGLNARSAVGFVSWHARLAVI
jgi:hypothetical protein